MVKEGDPLSDGEFKFIRSRLGNTNDESLIIFASTFVGDPVSNSICDIKNNRGEHVFTLNRPLGERFKDLSDEMSNFIRMFDSESNPEWIGYRLQMKVINSDALMEINPDAFKQAIELIIKHIFSDKNPPYSILVDVQPQVRQEAVKIASLVKSSGWGNYQVPNVEVGFDVSKSEEVDMYQELYDQLAEKYFEAYPDDEEGFEEYILSGEGSDRLDNLGQNLNPSTNFFSFKVDILPGE